ncbi:loganic acid O-methyltransferase-like [Ziziphus jujuba]|uniref:Loganic acid O-methyltransferase-like n=1 Tax=Ziziphus jujuba TaxID=326968 RepID=A0ABM3IJE6_ZIZJJ|nr:loganic acid O-methyltransferase-like [Ziziphus jujuba]
MEEMVAAPMNGGSGLYSYTRNSALQRKAIEAAEELINKAIAEKLEINNFLSLKTFQLADLGCSVGPNTFLTVQNIVDAVELKYQSQGRLHSQQFLEFQVFFNDHMSNDFNQLFTSLPPERRYFAMGVPGSFHGRLFPKASLHFFHSSYAVQWLSRVPKEVVDKTSPAWNKGSIHYSKASDEVFRAYEAQYVKDMERFLIARAEEIVCGGLLALIFPGFPNEKHYSEAFMNRAVHLLGSCLVEMAKKGMISEEKVDSFNIPTFHASLQLVEAIVKRNGCFSIEMMKSLPQEKPNPKILSSTMRASSEGMIMQHFGYEILEELFDLFCKKCEELLSNFEPEIESSLFVLLKRKYDN